MLPDMLPEGRCQPVADVALRWPDAPSTFGHAGNPSTRRTDLTDLNHGAHR